jgi:hypothetical protein
LPFLRPSALLAAGLLAVSLFISSAVFADEEVLDLPVPAALIEQVAGIYSVRSEAGGPAMSFQFSAMDDALWGRIDGNDPTRMLYQGGADFRPEDAPVFLVTFEGEGDRAQGISIQSPSGPMGGSRMMAPEIAETATSGTLYDELAALDARVFELAFVACDGERLRTLFTDDIEFYHDQNGLQSADDMRRSWANLSTECPGKKGVTRELVDGSLEVYPVADYGAVQMGEHRFIHADGAEGAVAKFVHLWKKTDDGWKISRVLSIDHQPIDSREFLPAHP